MTRIESTTKRLRRCGCVWMCVDACGCVRMRPDAARGKCGDELPPRKAALPLPPTKDRPPGGGVRAGSWHPIRAQTSADGWLWLVEGGVCVLFIGPKWWWLPLFSFFPSFCFNISLLLFNSGFVMIMLIRILPPSAELWMSQSLIYLWIYVKSAVNLFKYAGINWIYLPLHLFIPQKYPEWFQLIFIPSPPQMATSHQIIPFPPSPSIFASFSLHFRLIFASFSPDLVALDSWRGRLTRTSITATQSRNARWLRCWPAGGGASATCNHLPLERFHVAAPGGPHTRPQTPINQSRNWFECHDGALEHAIITGHHHRWSSCGSTSDQGRWRHKMAATNKTESSRTFVCPCLHINI